MWRLHSVSSRSFTRVLIPLPEQKPIRQHQRRTPTILEQVHEEYEEQVRRFPRLELRGKVALDPLLLLTPKGRIGEDYLHPVPRAVVASGASQRVVAPHLGGHVQPVQQQTGGAEQMREWFLFHPVDGALQLRLLLRVVDVARADVLDGVHQEATGAAGGSRISSPELGVRHFHHELRHRTRRVVLARVAGALQISEDLLVDVVEKVAILRAVEVDLVDRLITCRRSVPLFM